MDHRLEFNDRLKKLGNKHNRMAKGYSVRVRDDGLIVARPKFTARFGVPWLGLLLLVAGFFAFKGLVLASLGDASYEERVSKLRTGTAIERAGAWTMQPDRLTRIIAGYINSLVQPDQNVEATPPPGVIEG